MNNDDLHLNKIPQQFDYSMQNINSQNDENCMDLLDKLTYDDNTPNVNIHTPTNIGIKDDDKFTQEIMSALDRKDFDRILTLAISQSNNGNKMGNLLTETIHEIEKNSNKPIDGKIMEKLHNLVRSQPKSISTTTPLRATVAPIRNESIVCSSSSNMSNNTGFRSNKPTKSSDSIQDDFLSLISSDCKIIQSGTRSLPATPPISQVQNRPLSSNCVPIRSSNEQRKEIDQQQQQQQQQQQIQSFPSFCAYGTPQNHQQTQVQYLPINVNQFAQYPQSMMPQNIYVMPVMNNANNTNNNNNNNNPTESITPTTTVSQSINDKTGQQNNQISLLLGSSAAFFSMPSNTANNNPNQTVTTSNNHDNSPIIRSSLSGLVNSNGNIITNHGSNLPKLLPKPQHLHHNQQQQQHQQQHHHPIMPRTTGTSGTTVPYSITGSSPSLVGMVGGGGLTGGVGGVTMQPHHHQQHQQQQQQQHHQITQQQQQQMMMQHNNLAQSTFKRPTNRKSSVKSRAGSSRSSKSSNKKENNNNNKDNVLMAWEMSSQCGGEEESQQQNVGVSPTCSSQSQSQSQSSSSFITELTNGLVGGGQDQFCLINTTSTVGGGVGGGYDHTGTSHQEFDDLLDELVTILDVHYAQTFVNEFSYESSVIIEHIDPVRLRTAVIINTGDDESGQLFASACCSETRIIPTSNCVVIARQTATPTLLVPPLASSILSSSSTSSSSNNSTGGNVVDQQRVMQLLYAHLGRHSEILTPLLKCLLPPQQLQQHQSSSSNNNNNNNQHSRPLSVCTRLSEQDELTEDDLLADISPVKHDPTKLANLDRFLESCQSISPCSSLMESGGGRGGGGGNGGGGRGCYENDNEEMMEMLDEHEEHEEHNINNNNNNNDMMMMMMQQEQSIFLPFEEEVNTNSYTLQDFCGTGTGTSDVIASWLRKSKQRNKWTLNGTVIRSSKVLELPNTISEKKREKSLKKKATFKQLVGGTGGIGIGIGGGGTGGGTGGAVEEKLKRKSKKQRRMRKYLEKIQQIKGENEIENKNQDNIGTGGTLKMRIKLSQLKVVATTIVRSPDPPPPPLVDSIKQEQSPVPVQTVPVVPAPLPYCKQLPRRAKIKSNLAIVPPLVQRQVKKQFEMNTKRIFCTRKEDRRSSALSNFIGGTSGGGASSNNNINSNSNSSNTSPVKYRKLSPCKPVKRVKQKHQSVAMTTIPASPPHLPAAPPLPTSSSSLLSCNVMQEHPPLILKLFTKRQQEPLEPLELLDPPSLLSSPNMITPISPPLSNEQYNPHHHHQLSATPPSLMFPSNSNNINNNIATTSNTTGRLKLRLKLSSSSSSSHHTHTNTQEQEQSIPTTYEFSPSTAPVTLAPPVHHRPRPQLAALKFSPTHSSSDSDENGAAHNEISSLLERQEQRDPLSVVSGSSNTIMNPTGNHHHHHHSHHHNNSNNNNSNNNGSSTFPQLPVPYLVGSDPTVFIDPHEFDLVVVKNSKYKKVSHQNQHQHQQQNQQHQWACGGDMMTTNHNHNGSSEICGGTTAGTANLVDVVSSGDGGINNELFVPGCFIEQDKSHMSAWNHSSSPSMPVLAPQEPFSTVADNSGKSNHISLSAYSQSQINQSSQQQQPYSDSSDRLQQSPLCMTTSNPQTSQYSASQNEMRPDTIKSPYQHQSSHYQQPSYNGSCYMADNSVSAVSANASNNQSKTQIHSSPVASLQTTTGSSHIQDYSTYFQNTSQIQSLASSDTASFSSISLTSSSYQPISEHQSSKHSTSKRSSSSRSHQSEQSSSKKRKESSSQPSLQLASYPNNADIYNAYPNLDYHSNGFSDIMGLDRVKFYEQWSNPLNALCPSNIQWNSAMAEYCKQAASLMPQTGSSGFGLSGNSNPLSLTSNLNPGGSVMEYSNDISQSVDAFKYFDSYTAYAMAQPYMYPTFGGIPK